MHNVFHLTDSKHPDFMSKADGSPATKHARHVITSNARFKNKQTNKHKTKQNGHTPNKLIQNGDTLRYSWERG